GFALRSIGKALEALGGIGRKEARAVASLAIHEPNEPLIRELEFTSLRQLNLRGDFRLDLAHRLIVMEWQVLEGAAGERPDDVGAPSIIGEGISHPRYERK